MHPGLRAGALKADHVGVSRKRYAVRMKSANPPVRIEPQFRREMEEVLEEGESMAAMVEAAVRGEVAKRREHAEFVRRGLAAIQRTRDAGDGVPVDQMISRLRAKVAEARGRRSSRA